MKIKYLFIFFITFLFFGKAGAQNYNNIVNYNFNGTPVNGVKIVTTLPFTTGSQMPTITIQGFNYGKNQTIGLQIIYYIYSTSLPGNTSNFYYADASISSFGGYTPSVYLANENGYVVIFINDKPYFQRFTVSAFAKGMSADVAANYQGWTVVDQILDPTTDTNQILLPYQNAFSGTVNMPGTGIWNATGNVGIGTVNPGSYKLAVKGNIHAQQVNVDMNSWSDYVLKKDYPLPSLNKVKPT
jgi:hypothetical protein